jgi:uncharacterized membrane protein
MKTLFIRHIRLWVAALAGVLLYFFLLGAGSTLIRVLISWNCSAILFLTLVFWQMRRLNGAQMHARYIEEDAAAPVILIIVVLAALMSLVAIVALLVTGGPALRANTATGYGLCGLTVLSSWALVPTMFTTHYADMFYSCRADDRALHFPNTASPVFWDFVYFSFTIAAACQTADVATRSVAIRKVVIAHTIISFLFNAAILGFAINVTAGLIGSH